MDRRIQHTIGQIEDKVSNTFRVNDLAADVNLSPSHFRHVFRRETGTTVAQYVLNERMKAARILLETTYLRVKEIMILTGFHDDSHFAHDFRLKHGVPPSRYGNRSR